MTGGGFGGCTVNLVQAEHAETFASEVRRRYLDKTKIDPDIYVCRAADGASAALGNR
jgi:galactokinase